MSHPILSPIAVLGAGSWGTALALHLAHLTQSVFLWSHSPADVKIMLEKKFNPRFLTDFIFPPSLHPTASLENAIGQAQDILIATPSAALSDVLQQILPYLKNTSRILWASKGIDPTSGQLLHEVAKNRLGDQYPLAVLSGPSFAYEVASHLPTAVVIGSTNIPFAEDLIKRFTSPTFRVYLSKDIIGIEVGGIVKNTLAIACGISDGMGLGANARSALITRGLAEMTRLGLALGAEPSTFTGLTGVGDLVLTCTDNQSRNRRFGLALGQGTSPFEAERLIGQVVEGKRNTEQLVKLAHQHKVEMPITETVWEILQEKLTPSEALKKLFARTPKEEN